MCVCVCACLCVRERVSKCVSIAVYLWDFRYERTYHMCVCHNGVFVLFCFGRAIFIFCIVA